MSNLKSSKSTHMLSLTALFTALIACTTLVLKVPMPPLGYFNFGDLMIFFASLLLPLRLSVFAASFGSMIADLVGGYAEYAIFTFFIKGAQVLVIFALRKILNKDKKWISYIAANFVMAALYASVDGLLLQNFTQFLLSFGYNIIQGFTSTALFLIFYSRFEKLVDQLRSLDT